MRILILIALLFSSSVFASKIEDIEIIEAVNGEPTEFEFKVRSKNSDQKSFFFLAFDKNKKDHLEKLKYVHQKMAKPSLYKLDVDIPSFSAYPYGSSYSCSDIRFFQTLLKKH